MISRKDVITMKVPFPNINSELALKSHMYICVRQFGSEYEYIKCQSFKPKMLSRHYKGIIKHYCDEESDKTRNPFNKKTRIDCDKLFTSRNVSYDDKLKTCRNVCDDLFRKIETELLSDGYDEIEMDEEKLEELNPLITKIKF